MVSKKQLIEDLCSEALLQNKTKDLSKEKTLMKEMKEKLTDLIKKKKIKAKVKLGGSAAKDTFLGNNFDIDFFILFDYNTYQNENLSDVLEEAIKSLKPVRVHGSRDYFQVKKRIEIVPVLDIPTLDHLQNVTDASILHVDWVKKHLKKSAELRNEIKLAKIFFKGIGVYGAESYIRGISGHVTDILIIHYGSFLKMLKAVIKWEGQVEIDIEKHKSVLDRSKIEGPLVVVDPVQPNRNAAAAFSAEQCEQLKTQAAAFLENPEPEFFVREAPNKKELLETFGVVVQLKPYEGKKDIIGAKLMKAFEQIEQALSEFGIIESGWCWDEADEAYAFFSLTEPTLAKEYEREGPANIHQSHVARFKELYPNAQMRKGRMYATVTREKTTVKEYLLPLKKDSVFKERVKGFTLLSK